MTLTVIDLLTNVDLLNKAKEEFKQGLLGRKYKPPTI